MAVPQITINGTLRDIFGAVDIGSLRITLCGYGATVPRISGTAILANVAPLEVDCPAGTFSFTLWGNDVITPGPGTTFYVFEIIDDRGNVIQVLAYQFAGTIAVDLSTVAPYNPLPLPASFGNAILANPAGGALQTIAGSLLITGNLTVNGAFVFPPFASSTVAFSATPVFDAVNGAQFKMTLTGNVTGSTFQNGVIGPYIFRIVQDGVGGRTFVWPANVKGAGVVDPTPNAVSVQNFWWTGTELIATGDMLSF